MPILEKYNFSFDDINSKRCYILTGLSKDNLDDLAFQFDSVRPPVGLSIKNCIGFYLMRLRLGLSSNQLGSLYDVPSVYQVKQMVSFVRDI